MESKKTSESVRFDDKKSHYSVARSLDTVIVNLNLVFRADVPTKLYEGRKQFQILKNIAQPNQAFTTGCWIFQETNAIAAMLHIDSDGNVFCSPVCNCDISPGDILCANVTYFVKHSCLDKY